jgi:peptidoglycan LD-endopeptidase LytH
MFRVLVALILLAATPADIQRELRDVRADLVEATEAYNDARHEANALANELEQLERDAEQLEDEAAASRHLIEAYAVEVYKHGFRDPIFEAFALLETVDAVGYIAALHRHEQLKLEEAFAHRTRLTSTTNIIALRREQAELAEVNRYRTRLELTRQLSIIERDLEEALAEEQAERQREAARIARQKTLASGRTYSCPIGNRVVSFTDTYGAPRSGGRRHQGTDVFGPMNTPVYAFTGGVIARHSNSSLGGTSLYLQGKDGNTYYYAHLNGYTPSGGVGKQVAAGDHIAYNGNTGNARTTPPHVHFEKHPGGGGAVNPYPDLARVCFG